MKNSIDKRLIKGFSVLLDVYNKGAYSSLAINKDIDEKDRAYITRLVYGTLEMDVKSEYIISKLVNKRPDSKIRIIIKMGLFLLNNSDIPKYAIVDALVEMCEVIGKRQLKGFVNSFFNRYIDSGVEKPENDDERISFEYSVPLWLVKKYIKQYGLKETEEFLNVPKFTKEHIRANYLKISDVELKNLLDENNIEYIESENGGMFVRPNFYIKKLLNEGKITYQSIASIKCAETVCAKAEENVLDLCAAPGGKAVYIAERTKANVTACDIHPHRIKLIKDYSFRMGLKVLKIMINDALKFNPNFYEKYDKVICDVPCSGFGVANKKADIYLNKTEKDVEVLSQIQYEILCNGAKYLKVGGELVYSTCTMLREENYNQIGRFLKEHKNFYLIEKQQLLPNGKGMDGFFIAKIKRGEKCC